MGTSTQDDVLGGMKTGNSLTQIQHFFTFTEVQQGIDSHTIHARSRGKHQKYMQEVWHPDPLQGKYNY